MPAAALDRLASLVTEGAIKELIGLLAQQASLIGRLQTFSSALTKPLSVRSFESVDGEVYVIARGPENAIKHLRSGDPFLLLRTSETSVEVAAARLEVNQPIKPDKDTVILRIVASMTDDITHLIGLAGERRVEGLKGYRLGFAFELGGLPAMDFTKLAEAIPHLAAGIQKVRGG